jgi:type IX secretion system PorP/SprF family membrane protein
LLKKIFYTTIIVFSCLTIKGQDPHFSQFYANPLYLGPSFAGATEGGRVAGQYRDQWFDLGAKFRTYSLSYDYYFSSFNSGIGVNFISDVAGTSQLGVMQAGLHYSYNFKIFNVWHVRPGISFSYLQHGIYGDIEYIDDILSDGTGSAAPDKAINQARDIDAGSSMLIYTHDFWFGVTVDHLLKPNVSMHAGDVNIPMKTSIYGGYDFRRRGKLLKPSDDIMTFAFLYKRQEKIQQLDLGVYWSSHPIVLGIWYRGIPLVNSHRGDAVIFLAGMKTRNFNVGYSYDLTISNLLPHTKGSHEISFSVKFDLPKRRKKGAVPCPEF